MHYFAVEARCVDAAAAATLVPHLQGVFDGHTVDLAPEPHSDGSVFVIDNSLLVAGDVSVTGAIRCVNDHSDDLKAAVQAVIDAHSALISSVSYMRHLCGHDESEPALCVNEVF